MKTPIDGLREIVREQIELMRNANNPDLKLARAIFAGARTEVSAARFELEYSMRNKTEESEPKINEQRE